MLSYRGAQLPIYGDCITFAATAEAVLVDDERRPAAMDLRRTRNSVVKRIGYGLFSEIATLLTVGQPVAHARTPTLDLHIALLREMILAGGITLVEVPPIPHGYEFIACLTGQAHPWTDPGERSAHKLGSGVQAAACLYGFCQRLLARF
jgi:hypothetical protein